MDIAPGSMLCHYRVEGKLGEGGMGVVYKARDTHLDRFVAIKVLPPDKVADPERRARFVQEAKAASALNHPNIVTVHDIASHGGTDFMVMEYVPGGTLDQRIPGGGMRVPEALKVAAQIIDALARAHAAGIVHRDLKPSNLMVDDHGLVKVLDFGLAKLTEAAGQDGELTLTMRVRTQEGTVLGTPHYMAPEQVEGRPADARADIFAFGCVLYQMLAGRYAFEGKSAASVMAAVLTAEPPPLSDLRPLVSPALDRIVRRCMAKDPEERWQSARDVRHALELAAGDAAGPPSCSARWRRVWASPCGSAARRRPRRCVSPSTRRRGAGSYWSSSRRTAAGSWPPPRIRPV